MRTICFHNFMNVDFLAFFYGEISFIFIILFTYVILIISQLIFRLVLGSKQWKLNSHIESKI